MTIRLPVDVLEKLDTICKIGNMKRSIYIINTIIAEFDALEGNPQLKELLETMGKLTEQFNSFKD